MSETEIDQYEAATAWVQRWRRAEHALEDRRLAGLRALSEREAAWQFAVLLSVHGDYPLRRSSGLVEQQRLFDRLRDRG